MLKLKSISLRNWCRTVEASITFPESGYVLVRGQNHTAEGQVDSSGSGKTSLGEAINRTLLGSSLSTSLSDYSRDWAGNTYVSVKATLFGKSLHVELGYKCDEFPTSDGEGLRFTYDNQAPVERPRAAQTRIELSKLIGITPEVAMWTIFIDGERLKFNRLSQADALGLLMQAIDQPPWDEYQSRAVERRDLKKASFERAKVNLTWLKSSNTATVNSCNQAKIDFESAEKQYRIAHSAYEIEIKKHQKNVQLASDLVLEAAVTRDKLKKEIRLVQEADATKFGKLELEITRLLGEQRTTSTYLAGWKVTISTYEMDLNNEEKSLRSMTEGKSCPTCKRAFPIEAVDPDTLASISQKIIALKRTHQDAVKDRNECQRCLVEIDGDLKILREQQAELRSAQLVDLSKDLEIAEENISRADRQFRSIERQTPLLPSDSIVQQTKTILGERQEQLSKIESDIVQASAQLVKAEHDLRLTTYWIKGFSPEGIPNLVLRQTVGPLNDAARLISESISGGVVKVKFASDTELASGAYKPKLVTEVETLHGAGKLSRNSKGELGRANLIIAETQTQVGRILQKVGYRWFDEAVNSQDPVVRRNIYSYLHHQALDRGLLTFVVDHHEEAASCANHVLVANKSLDGFTTYEWE